jgi:hypothetical protein
MSEILDNDRPEPDPWQEPVAAHDRYDLSPDADRAATDEVDAAPTAGRRLVTAFGEAASLAVASVLGVVAAVAVGPGYRFDVFPFNQSVFSLAEIYGNNQLQHLHPLRTYLINVAPTALLVVAAVVAGVLALSRPRPHDPSWARPVAAGAVLAALALAVLVAVGAWHTSTLDLTVPPGQ